MPGNSAPRRIAFLDRDGIINANAPNKGYVLSPAQFELLPEVLESLASLRDMGFEFIIVTNQQGVGKGLMSEADLSNIHEAMTDMFATNEVSIRGIYHCPHLASAGCTCRKPQPGMLLQAAEDHDVDLSQAIFIGDSLSDAQAGQSAGVRTFFLTSNPGALSETFGSTPVVSLFQVIELLRAE